MSQIHEIGYLGDDDEFDVDEDMMVDDRGSVVDDEGDDGEIFMPPPSRQQQDPGGEQMVDQEYYVSVPDDYPEQGFPSGAPYPTPQYPQQYPPPALPTPTATTPTSVPAVPTTGDPMASAQQAAAAVAIPGTPAYDRALLAIMKLPAGTPAEIVAATARMAVGTADAQVVGQAVRTAQASGMPSVAQKLAKQYQEMKQKLVAAGYTVREGAPTEAERARGCRQMNFGGKIATACPKSGTAAPGARQIPGAPGTATAAKPKLRQVHAGRPVGDEMARGCQGMTIEGKLYTMCPDSPAAQGAAGTTKRMVKQHEGPPSDAEKQRGCRKAFDPKSRKTWTTCPQAMVSAGRPRAPQARRPNVGRPGAPAR